MGRQRQRQRERRRQEQEQTRVKQPARPGRNGGGVGRGTWIAAGVVLIAAIAVFAFAVLSGAGQGKTGAANPTATSTVVGHTAPTVDGVKCGSTEQLAYHIHEHLDLYDHGLHVNVPAYIGIPTYVQNNQVFLRCFYWIHVHAETPNILHVESPLKKTFTLGSFFDVWLATASTTLPTGNAYVRKLQASRGQITAFYNGKRWDGNYRTIPLKSHGVITVEIGTPLVPPKQFTAWGNL